MTDKNTYWIADPQGVKAKVVGTEARGLWIQVHGWTETTEPFGYEFQWVRNADHGGKGVLNHEAAVLAEERGWFPSGPEGYDEPSTDSPAAAPAPASANPKPAANATSGKIKE